MAPATRTALAALGISLASALFFTSTYVLNRAMVNGGGHWAWSAALRYLMMLPLLLALMPWQGGVAPVHRALRRAPRAWLVWSGIGFGLFYLFLSFAAASGPAWLIAGSFQLTVIAGMLLAPFLYRDARRRVPRAALAVGCVVIAGVALMQYGHFDGRMDRAAWIAFACVVVGAICYPLGNRKILLHLERTGEDLNATQRVYGMTFASLPVWLAASLFAWMQAGWPSLSQLAMTFGVALFSGVIATVLFFQATGMVRNDPTALGAAEAMQASEILFATLLGAIFLHEAWPHGLSAFGVLVVVAGIAAFGLLAGRQSAGKLAETKALRSDRAT